MELKYYKNFRKPILSNSMFKLVHLLSQTKLILATQTKAQIPLLNLTIANRRNSLIKRHQALIKETIQ
jgi:hypothetical protein